MLLLLVGAARWMVVSAHPEADSTLASEALGCVWAAILSLAFLLRQPRSTPQPPVPAASRVRHLLAGAMLFGGPAAPLLIHGPHLDAASLTIALALTPIVIAIATSAFGTQRSDNVAGRIWPGLAAVAGLLLLLAQPTLGDVRTDLALILAPTLTGIGAALFCAQQPVSASRGSTALLGASILFTLALAGAFVVTGSSPSISLLASASDGVMALLGVITLVQLGATRWSAQFTWIPLLIVIESIALVRPQLTTYLLVGLALLAVASIYLLVPENDESNTEKSPVPG